MNKISDITVIAFGNNSVGKSQNGCAFLQKNDIFEVNTNPNSYTFRTIAQSQTIDGITRHCIDTQGLICAEDHDDSYIQQMFSLLKEWILGINGLFLLIDSQNPNFDKSIQKLILLINDFFQNPDIWNQAGIIFTKCYKGKFNRADLEVDYREIFIDFIKTLPGCQEINPKIPCFFVDSKKWETEKSTISEYDKIFQFSYNNKPIPTQKDQLENLNYKSKEEEILKKAFVGSEIVGEDEDRKLICHYEDHSRYKITDLQGNITYTDIKTVNSYIEVEETIVFYETKWETTETIKSFYCPKKRSRILGIFGHRPRYMVHDYDLITITRIEYKRKVLKFPDGEIKFFDWEPTGIKEVETYKS